MSNVDTWVAALRSGEYQQVGGTLGERTPEGLKYCCLGVVCELAGSKRTERSEVGNAFFFDGMSGVLPASARDWLGVGSSDPLVDIPSDVVDRDGYPVREVATCSAMNDDWELTFSQIADMVDYFGMRGDD